MVESIEGPLVIGAGFMGEVSLMLVVMCIFRAIVCWNRYRRNPLDYPIRDVLVLLMMAGVLSTLLVIYWAPHGGEALLSIF